MKSINLFGQEEHVFTNRRKSQKSIFDDYEGFVEKFNPKKTTDDCYTPPAVYDYVLQYVADHCDIDGMTVVRPFYPGGDYESLVYPDNCVVIDNPPCADGFGCSVHREKQGRDKDRQAGNGASLCA